MRDATITQLNSPGWVFFTKASFALSVVACAVGIYYVPAVAWVKGYLAMGLIYAIGSSFMLSKTLRDDFEGEKLVNKLAEARTEKMLKDYQDDVPAM
jgi:hypothetical protein